jgi:hypothetical protein
VQETVYGSPTYGFPAILTVVVPLTTEGVWVTAVVVYARIVVVVKTAPVVVLMLAAVMYEVVIVEVINSIMRPPSMVLSLVMVITYVQFSMLAS